MQKTHSILLVGLKEKNLQLLTEFFQGEGYNCISTTSLMRLDEILSVEKNIAVALLDSTGFNNAIWESCKTLYKKKIPVFLISSKQTPQLQQMALASGVQCLLQKPLVKCELLKLITSITVE